MKMLVCTATEVEYNMVDTEKLASDIIIIISAETIYWRYNDVWINWLALTGSLTTILYLRR